MRSLAFLNLRAFVAGVREAAALPADRFADALRRQARSTAAEAAADLPALQARIRVFAVVSGVVAPDHWGPGLGDFVLGALGRLFLVENIRESLEPKDQRGVLCVDLGLALEATRDAWGRFGHGPRAGEALAVRLLTAARAAGCLPLYDWLDGIVAEWLAAAAAVDAELLALFHRHDADQSGVGLPGGRSRRIRRRPCSPAAQRCRRAAARGASDAEILAGPLRPRWGFVFSAKVVACQLGYWMRAPRKGPGRPETEACRGTGAD